MSVLAPNLVNNPTNGMISASQESIIKFLRENQEIADAVIVALCFE
jgi:hypothetical protein